MALTVHKPEGQDFVVADEKLWLTTDDTLVPDGHRAASVLFATPGKRIPLDVAVKYGLAKDPKPKATLVGETGPELVEAKSVEAPENKAVEAPEADKATEPDTEPEAVETPAEEPAPEPAKRARKATKKRA